MATLLGSRWLTALALGAAAAFGATRLCADQTAGSTSSATPAATASAGVDVFDAMRDGDLGVQFIPKNSREATLILTNNTDAPLNVHLPEAFAATPVLAQFGGAGGGNNNRNTNNNNNNNKNQSVGTGTNNNNRGAGGFGGAAANGQGAAPAANVQAGNGGAAFSIPPERVVKVKLPTVCLEYGKQEPAAHIPYTIVPIDKYTTNPELQELCRLLGTGKVDQQIAQAAAWHLANHMNWDQLADLKHFPHNRGYSYPIFTPEQIRAAMMLTDRAIKMADARSAPAADKSATSASPSPGAASTPARAAGIN